MRFIALVFPLLIATHSAFAGFPCPPGVTDPQSQCFGVQPDPSFLQTCKGGDTQCIGKGVGVECLAPGLDGQVFHGECYLESEALGTCVCEEMRSGS